MTADKKPSTRDRLLQAAAQVVRTHGADRLTLDAVAAEAGVSKGGLLYHFASKEALVRGMTEAYLRDCSDRLQDELAREPVGRPGRWLRAYIRARFSETPVSLDMIAAFNVALGTDPALMQLILDDLRNALNTALADGLEPAHALLIHMAVEGYYQTHMISGLPIDPELSERLRDRLLALTETDA